MTLVYKDGSRSWEKQVSLVARWRWQGLGSGSGSGSSSSSGSVVVVLLFMCLMVAVGSGAVASNNNNNNSSETASAVTSSSSSNVPHLGAEAVMVVHNPWISLAPFSNLSFNSDTRNKECLAPLDSGSWCLLGEDEEEEEESDQDLEDDGDVAAAAAGGGARDGGASSNAEQCLERHRPLRSVCAMVDDEEEDAEMDEEFGDGEGQEEKRRRRDRRRRKRKRRRSQVWANATLGFCNGPKLANVLGSGGLPKGRGQCHSVISKLQELDKLAQRIYCEFEEVLARYDCQQKYSIKWSCDDCKEEYKRWVCAMLIPYHMEDHQVKPCREFCHRVEQKCPYLLPDTKLQYAGEPSFLCIDDNIPETAKMSPCSAYGSAPNCYLPCHLGVVDVGVATNQCPELSSYYDIWVNGSSSRSNCTITNTDTSTATATATGNAGMQMQMVAGCSSSSSAPAARMMVEGDSSCSGSSGGGIGALWPHCAKTLAIMAMCLAFFRTLVAHPFCLGLT